MLRAYREEIELQQGGSVMEKLSRKQVEKIVEEFLIDDIISGEMYEHGEIRDIAMSLLDVEAYDGWWRETDIARSAWDACIPLKVSEEIRKLEEIICEQTENKSIANFLFETYLKNICETLKEGAWEFLGSMAEVEVLYDRDDEAEDLILIIGDYELQMDYDETEIVKCFLSEGWLDEVLNGEYYNKEDVIESVKSFLDEDAYERLQKMVKDACSFDSFTKKLEKFLKSVKQYMKELCKTVEEKEKAAWLEWKFKEYIRIERQYWEEREYDRVWAKAKEYVERLVSVPELVISEKENS